MSVKSINRVKSIDFGYSSLYNAKYREKMQVTCSRYINSGPRAGDRSWSPPLNVVTLTVIIFFPGIPQRHL